MVCVVHSRAASQRAAWVAARDRAVGAGPAGAAAAGPKFGQTNGGLRMAQSA